jgi:hypothetical protein
MRAIFFLLLPCAVFGQTLTTDTSYITQRDSVFFQVKILGYDNGKRITEETPIGSDTAAVANAIIGDAYPQFQNYAAGANRVLTSYLPMRQLLNGVNTSLLQTTGVNYLNTMAAQIGDEFVGPYLMRVNGVNIEAEIVRLNNGALRYRQGGTNFVIAILSRNWIRLIRYDGSNVVTPNVGTFVDFFADDRGVFVSNTDGTGVIRFVLRKVNVRTSQLNR